MKGLLAGLAAGAAAGALTAFLMTRGGGDASVAWLEANRTEVERQVLADVARYGVDIYRLYMEVSLMLPGMPDANFGTDKAIKKLQVTYPDSNVRRIAEAFVVYGAIRKRDMMQIERYLETSEQRATGRRQLMPNGFEIEPQLVAAQYNYFFHTGRFDEAARLLDHIAATYPQSWLFQPQGRPLSIADFVASQRRILEIVRRKEAK